ncbi:MAG: DNA replication/repair protein RecF [Steroidobacteraceae bacterium]
MPTPAASFAHQGPRLVSTWSCPCDCERVSLTRLTIDDLRCIQRAELELHPRLNLFVGANGSGKTSLLEAVYCLGRGRSFRSRRLATLVRKGADCMRVVGEAHWQGQTVTLGLEARAGETRLKARGATAASAAALAEYHRPQVIDPDIHKLLEEGPGRRRRYLDWGVFHVEPLFLATWQRYHRAIKQRNAVLRARGADPLLRAWEEEVTVAGEALSLQRLEYLGRLEPVLREVGERLLGAAITLDYTRGWASKGTLAEALRADEDRDRRFGITHSGPHRADITTRVDGVAARDRVSRGQQKMLAAALVLAQLKAQGEGHGAGDVLLLDDPAAELDAHHLGRLLELVADLPAQLWVTSLAGQVPGLAAEGAMFHVEHGRIRPTATA